jgi:hypothetical protein
MRNNKRFYIAFILFYAVFLLSKPAISLQQQTVSQKGDRIIHFPKDRSIGRLMIGDADTTNRHNPFDYIQWEEYCSAQGNVIVPNGKFVKLFLASWTWQNLENLSIFKQLRPDDIYSLTIKNDWHSADMINPMDKCMSYVAYLTGLNTLDISQTGVSAEGLAYLTKLTALERLETPIDLNDAGITEICKIKSLKTLLMWQLNLVTNTGLRQLSGLQSLECLTLNSYLMTDEGLCSLSGLPVLNTLMLSGCFTKNAALFLQDIKSLKSLHLYPGYTNDWPEKSVNQIGGKILTFGKKGMENVSKLTQLEEFSAYIPDINDSDIAYLQNIPNLKTIYLGSNILTDSSMQVISKIRTLENLALTVGLTDDGLKHITDLQNLRHLDIGSSSSSPLTDESLRCIGQLENLEVLCIGSPVFSDEGIKYIAKLKKLRRLSISKAEKLSKNGLGELTALTSLTSFSLQDALKISVSDLKVLNRLKNLKTLDIFGIYQHNTAFMDISGLTKLKTLNIGLYYTLKNNARVYDSSFRGKDFVCLTGLKYLKNLSINGSGINDSCLKYISQIKNLASLEIDCSKQSAITDAGIKYLSNLKKLWYIRIENANVTEKSLDYLFDMPALSYLEIKPDQAVDKKAIKNFREVVPVVVGIHTVVNGFII